LQHRLSQSSGYPREVVDHFIERFAEGASARFCGPRFYRAILIVMDFMDGVVDLFIGALLDVAHDAIVPGHHSAPSLWFTGGVGRGIQPSKSSSWNQCCHASQY